jgi:hypothetical protein
MNWLDAVAGAVHDLLAFVVLGLFLFALIIWAGVAIGTI